MKLRCAGLFLLLMAVAAGGELQEEFLAAVKGATAVAVTRPHDRAILLRTFDAKQVARAIRAIELIDPVETRNEDGSAVVPALCSCPLDYVFTFLTADGEKHFYVKHGGNVLIPSTRPASGKFVNQALSARSTATVRKWIRRLEKDAPHSPGSSRLAAANRPCQPLEPGIVVLNEVDVGIFPHGILTPFDEAAWRERVAAIKVGMRREDAERILGHPSLGDSGATTLTGGAQGVVYRLNWEYSVAVVYDYTGYQRPNGPTRHADNRVISPAELLRASSN